MSKSILVSDMYDEDVLRLRWHHTGVTWGRDIRLKSFDLTDIRTVPAKRKASFTGKMGAGSQKQAHQSVAV